MLKMKTICWKSKLVVRNCASGIQCVSLDRFYAGF